MPVSAHHKYQQQYVELRRSLAWLGELQLTSATAERGGAADYMQTIWHLIISSGRHLTKKLIYNVTVCFYICLFYSTDGSVFESNFNRFFDRKPNQITPLGIRVDTDLQAVGYKKQDTLQYSFPADPPWLLKRPHINFSLHSSYKEDTPPKISLKFLSCVMNTKVSVDYTQMGHCHSWRTGWLVQFKSNFLRICSTIQQY